MLISLVVSSRLSVVGKYKEASLHYRRTGLFVFVAENKLNKADEEFFMKVQRTNRRKSDAGIACATSSDSEGLARALG